MGMEFVALIRYPGVTAETMKVIDEIEHACPTTPTIAAGLPPSPLHKREARSPRQRQALSSRLFPLRVDRPSAHQPRA